MTAKLNKETIRQTRKSLGRDQILKAALQEFSSKGYAGATTSGIARVAGVTQPLVHHHFKSKKQLWYALLENIYEDFGSIMAHAETDETEQDPYDYLRSRLKAFVHFTRTHTEFSRIVVLESVAGGEAYDYLYEEYIEPELIQLRTILGIATEQGVIRDNDPELLPFMIVSSVVHLYVAPEGLRRLTGLNLQDPEISERYAELIADILLEGLKPR